MAGNSRDPGVTVASRALALLGAFDHEHRMLTLSEMAARAGQAVPTAHRLVADLMRWGALVRRADGGYVIGARMWDIGLLAPGQAGLREVAAPFLHDMYAATLATVHLAERDGTEVLYLDRISGRATVPVVSRVGGRLPLHATAVGKVLLAYAPAEIRQRALADLRRITPFTITQPSRLVQQHRFEGAASHPRRRLRRDVGRDEPRRVVGGGGGAGRRGTGGGRIVGGGAVAQTGPRPAGGRAPGGSARYRPQPRGR